MNILSFFFRFLLAIVCVLALPATLFPSQASAFESDAKQAILMDANSGSVLYAKDADARMGPSSMSKMMTVYLLLERLKQGGMKLEDQFYVSERAWRMQGSKMFVAVGSYVSVEDLLRGIAIQSGNDACVVVAEALAGSEEAFATMMNDKARQLGLTGSHFANSTGWPDPEHYMTAHDLAVLARALIRDFPEYYHYWSEPEFTYNNIRQYNRNTLLGELGVDGLKTGHTEDAGYGITVSGKKEGRRLIVAVNGLTSMKARIAAARALMIYGYTNFEQVTLFTPGDDIAQIATWYGVAAKVAATVEAPIALTLPRTGRDAIKIQALYDEPVATPVQAGQKLGELQVTLPGENEPHLYPLVAKEAVETLPATQRMMQTLKYRLFGGV